MRYRVLIEQDEPFPPAIDEENIEVAV